PEEGSRGDYTEKEDGADEAIGREKDKPELKITAESREECKKAHPELAEKFGLDDAGVGKGAPSIRTWRSFRSGPQGFAPKPPTPPGASTGSRRGRLGGQVGGSESRLREHHPLPSGGGVAGERARRGAPAERR